MIENFSWQRPDYGSIVAQRIATLRRLRATPGALAAMRAVYRDDPARFIDDWGYTSDPRNVERGLPAAIPFKLWPRQVEWCNWVLERWKRGEPGITEKSRDSGVSWLAIALGSTLCLFNHGLVIGFGSRKEEYIDQRGAPKALFEKARFFLQHLPAEFLGGWERDKHAPHMRVLFPSTGSAMTGEAGDGIGRGDRTSLYLVDESAFLERPQLVDASLSATTNCRIDISTPNGRGNPFAERRHSGRIPVFTFHWRDDPRKGEDWYRRQVATLDPVTLAQEVDINYSASVEGIVIPAAWVNAAIDAHKKLGITPSGSRCAALDVADEGIDKNALAMRHGIALEHLESWSGKGGDIFATVVRAFGLCEQLGVDSLEYDADGLGSGVRGDARIINEQRQAAKKPAIYDSPFRGSAGVLNDTGQMVPGRLNRDLFANLKAQAWWALRLRFQRTYRAVVDGMRADPDELISLDSRLPELTQLAMELSQPTYTLNTAGRIVIDKKPDGARSPNLADAVMICYGPGSRANLMRMWTRLAG